MRRVKSFADAFAGLMGMTAGAWAAPMLDQSEWHDYRDRFVESDGRVVDRDNGLVPHSESRRSWTDLVLDSVDTHGWSDGVAAIAALTWTTMSGEEGRLSLPKMGIDQGCFSSSLYLLTKPGAGEIP